VKRTGGVALAAVVAALAVPAAAWAHAALLRAVPSPSQTLNTPPKQLALTYSEAVEPRFAIVSVTDAAGHQQTAGPPTRSPANIDTLVVPLKQLGEGWYLVWWRVISEDGHPVRGAYTFAVGPNPGPAPQFVIPSTSETATTGRLLIARWIAFLSVMGAIGIFALRMGVARPLIRRVSGTRLRAVSIAFVVASAIALVAIPIYAFLATAQFALRSVWNVGAIVPLMRASSFGRGYLDLWLTFAFFVVAAPCSPRERCC
jgi:methionine-rich copper-binding protein CopC